ncbi:MAG: DUF4175 domain-containing protein [Actinomycetota bacterium]
MRPTEPPADPDARRLSRRLAWARLALGWERLWPAVVPILSLAAAFAALALFDVLPRLPAWLHALVLAGFAGGAGFLAWRGVAAWRTPTVDEAARRLERDSGLAHRPLAALADVPVAGDEVLWQAHRRRMARLAQSLRVAPPAPGMAARDPRALRFAALLLLVIALAGGWTQAGPRLARALDPGLSAMMPVAALEVWITPPAYTGLPPVMLVPGRGADTPTVVPAGSKAMAVLSGGWGAAAIEVDGRATAFQRLDDGSQRGEVVLDRGSRLAVTQGFRTVAHWPVTVMRDALPSIAFTEPPAAGDRGRLHIVAEASDDYGLAKAWVSMRRLGAPDGEEPLVVELPLPGGRPRAAAIDGWHDLTAHPWAGLPVVATPTAQDGLGQVGTGEPVTVTLPERSFTNPLARALVEKRRLVTDDRYTGPDVSRWLAQLLAEPDALKGDERVVLALALARRVLMDVDEFDLAEVQDLLWNAALRLEEGDLAGAEKALEDARRELEQALSGDAPAEEVQRLLDQYEAALERYLEALAERLAETGREPAAGAQVLSDDDLQQMLDGMRGLAETGDREAMRQMLDQLSKTLQGLQAATPQMGEAGKAMQQLRDVARRQQEMQGQSFRRSQEGQDGQPGSEGQRAAQSQEALRKALDQAGKALGQATGGSAPSALDQAGQAMVGASGALARGAWGEAAEQQGEALRLMREGAADAMKRLDAQGRGSGQLGLVPRDPLGRPMRGAGFGDDGSTRLPARSEVQRAREILDELRRRAQDWHRPEDERDYLHRLLRQF